MTSLSLARSYLVKAQKRLKALAVLRDEGAHSDVVREASGKIDSPKARAGKPPSGASWTTTITSGNLWLPADEFIASRTSYRFGRWPSSRTSPRRRALRAVAPSLSGRGVFDFVDTDKPGVVEYERVMGTYEFTVVIERDEDGRYVAIWPSLQGCYTEGETEAEALALILSSGCHCQ